jgi:5'-nucleotidase
MSHRVTTDAPIHAIEIEPAKFRVEGTPADCARIAITCLAPDAEWLIAGINRGGNLGADTYISGTVAAAREAALLGRNAVAVSQYVAKGRQVDWAAASVRTRAALERIFAEEQAPGAYWNVNLPHPAEDAAEPAIVFCPVDPSPLDVRFRRNGTEFHYSGNYHGRRRIPGSDVDRCFSGDVAISKLTV